MYEQQFLSALVLTLTVEVLIVFGIVRCVYKKKNIGDILISVFVASLLTLPYLWFIFPAYYSVSSVYAIYAEIIIALIEAILYWRFLKITFIQALIVSIIANATSALIGFI